MKEIEILKREKSDLIESHKKLAESVKVQKEQVEAAKDQQLEAAKDQQLEAAELKQQVAVLQQDLAKFVKGTENLNKLLGDQKCIFDKAGLGYRKSINQIYYKNFFVPEKGKSDKCTCCSKMGHKASSCFLRQKVTKRKKSNQKGPKQVWVPRKTQSVAAGHNNHTPRILNSRCSRHMTGSRNLFLLLEEKDLENVIFGDNTKVQI